MAWHRKRPEIGAEVLAFTIPIKPSKQTGLSYDSLPSLTKEFLSLSRIIDHRGGAVGMTWLRANHIGDFCKSERCRIE